MKSFILSQRPLVVAISLMLFILPFFWFKPGEMNIGGDGGRLYFYDPVDIFIHLASYAVMPFGTGSVSPLFHYLPLVIILIFLKSIINSPFLLIALYSGMKITISFLAVYGIVNEFIGNRSTEDKHTLVAGKVASILAGLFYVFNPAMTENYVRALPSHDQVFLNPLIFYLVLRYMNTDRLRYLFYCLFGSLLFHTIFRLRRHLLFLHFIHWE